MSGLAGRMSSRLIALLALAAVGCATPADRARQMDADAVVFVLVRHAEKAIDDPKDPALSEAGIARAARFADALASVRMTAVYATAYRRTQLTAAPTARSHRLDVRTYDASRPATDFARELLESHRTGTVLVVGHSNTIPALAASLCACQVAPMEDDEFDRLMYVSVAADGTARLDVRHD